MATTAAAIRNAMLDLVDELTPDDHESVPFRAHRELMSFDDWAEQNAATCLRRFSIRSTGGVTPPTVTNTDVEWVETDFEVRVAYPTSGRFGGNHLTSLDDAIENDMRAIERRIGTNGYAVYAQLTAGATVTTVDTGREYAGNVTYGIVRLHAGFYRTMGIAEQMTITGLNGVALAQGDIITLAGDGEAAMRAVVMSNGIFRVTYERPDEISSEFAPVHCHVWDGSTWLRCLNRQYGDWSGYAVPIPSTADELEVLEVSDTAIEFALRWNALELDTPYLSNLGIPYRDWNSSVNYPQSSANAKYITEIKLHKLVRLELGHQGYFTAWHSDPKVGPAMSELTGVGAPRNNEANYGERELGTGSGTAVAWTSNGGNVARFPAWGERPEWNDDWVTYSNHAWWAGIDDPTYPPTNQAAYIAAQDAGFPREQASGPMYVGDLPGFEDHDPVARFLVCQRPIELGVWQFEAQMGAVVAHFCNEWPGQDGRELKYQVYIGAFPYQADESDDFANEPKASLVAEVANRAAALVWPN